MGHTIATQRGFFHLSVSKDCPEDTQETLAEIGLLRSYRLVPGLKGVGHALQWGQIGSDNSPWVPISAKYLT